MSNIDLLSGLQGFRDYYPEYWREINYILNNMRNVSRSYGYLEYEGPSLERVELIEAKSGADLIKEIFTLTDRNDSRLLLRPEQTPTLARMLAKEQQRYKRPIRWFSIPRLFRDETVQKGREREFWQLNVDILGEESVSADAEVIAVAVDIIREVGLEDKQFNMFVNHRELLNSFINSITKINPQKLIPIIDKRLSLIQSEITDILKNEGKSERESEELGLLYRRILISSGEFKKKLLSNAKELTQLLENEDEISEKVMVRELVKNGLKEENALKLYNLTNIKGPPSQFIKAINNLNLPKECVDVIEKLEVLGTYLDGFGVGESIIFDASLARGLDYYTGVVFEAFDSTGQIVRAICGGGRYDDLVSDIGGGTQLKGTGFGMGELVLLELAKLNDVITEKNDIIDLYLVPIKKGSIPFILKLATELRKNFSVRCNPYPWKINKHFEYADDNHFNLMIFAGPKDITNNQISVRKVETGDNFTLVIDEKLEENLKKLLD
ncbi:MAG: Histidine--tRNA ligase [Candidatus Heimdallarchaeota archaeon LC_2]|nr:MAG: Histidine--tRNA ligase [Candidatus Heimdallarchaeota archaeon LC_2]